MFLVKKNRRLVRVNDIARGSAAQTPWRTAAGNRNFRSHVLSLPGAKVPCMELSLPGTFVPWNFRSRERK